MIPACKGKGSNRRFCQKKNEQQTINTVQILLVLILSTWSLAVILDICKRILLLSFKAFNTEYIATVSTSERIVRMSVFHKAKVVWCRLAHIPMGKNEGI